MKSSFEGMISLKKTKVFVKKYGTKGPDLVLIHGGPGWDHSYFLPFILPLAANLKLTFFDLKDCGLSKSYAFNQRSNTTYLDSCVEDLTELLEKLNIREVNLLGFSFGGRVAMNFIETHPNRVDRLILASSTYSGNFRELLQSKSEYQNLMDFETSAKLIQLWSAPGDENGSITRTIALEALKFNIHQSLNWDIAKKTLEKICFSDLWGEGYSTEKSRILAKKDYSNALKYLKSKLFIIHGEKDLVFPSEMATQLHQLIPESRLSIIKNAGHLTHIDASDEWIESVRLFMNH